jgi:hypothetical protein
VPYPPKRRWPLIAGAALALMLVAAVVAAIVVTRGDDGADSTALTEASAKTAIQEYLNALSDGDDETIARHTLCGLFDAVQDRRSDLALAGLSGDAFRKQYDGAEVTSIDKMVLWSADQAQVLFTMRALPAVGSGDEPDGEEQQAVAQLINDGDEILVCSYLPRNAGQF